MNKLILLYICILIGFENETLSYDLNFMGMNAGESILSIKKSVVGESSVYHLTSTTKTNSFLDKIYKIRDQINVILDASDFSIQRVEKKMNEGGRKKLFKSIINYNDSTAVSNNKILKIPGKVLDPFGSIYYLRNKNINVGDIFEFNTYDNDKIKNITVIAKKIEQVETSIGKYECIIIEPYIKNKISLNKKGQMKIWLTNNVKKIPVKIENITSAGTMTMILKDIK